MSEFHVGEYVKKVLENNGVSIRHISKVCNIKYQTLSAKLINNTLTANEILNIGKVLNIDLNEMKEVCYKQLTEGQES